MSGSARWYFTEEQLANSPSRRCGMAAEVELSQRQRAANLIQDMGQRLQVSQLCINTGIVYMHRFYAFHSFSMFHRNSIAAAAFFLAAKVEEQPRKLEHVIKILNLSLEKHDVSRDAIPEMTQELVFHENILLQTLGFDVAIDHPHTHVVRACQLFNIVEVSKELRQTCYFMASNSLHLTTMCLKYKPTVVAAFCIYLACRWARWEIPNSSEGKPWYSYVDETVTLDTLKKLTDEYLQILERSPSKFKNKMKSMSNSNGTAVTTIGQAIRDEPSTSGQTGRHHHHQQRSSSSNNSSSSSSNMSNRKPEVPAQAKQPPAMSQSHSSSGYKNQQMHPVSQTTTSNTLQRPSSSTSSSSASRSAYSGESNNSGSNQKSDRTHTDGSFSRSIDAMKQQQSSRMSMSQQSSSSSNQQQPPPPPSSSHMKPSNHDQRHSMGQPKPPLDYQQQQNKKPTSATDYSNRASSSSTSSSHLQQPPLPSQQMQQQASMLHKKPSWPQQQSQQQSQQQMSQQPKSQVPLTSSHSHPTLNTSTNMHRSNMFDQSNKSSLYDQSNKSLMSSSQQPMMTTNDLWFNDTKPSLELPQSLTSKNPTPPKQGKSMFSPSPEHEPVGFDRTKLMMMSSANVKRERDSPKSDKTDRRSTTPNKKEKQRAMENQLGMKSQSQQSTLGNMQDKNKHLSGANLLSDSKKRSYPDMDEISRDNKLRKVDQKQMDFSMMLNKAQPIETNPDAVKSLLQECFKQEANKFDVNGDSPLDVLTPTDPTAGSLTNLSHIPTTGASHIALQPSPLISVHPNQFQTISYDHLQPKAEPLIDNGTSDEYSSSHKKHSKSKKNKKDKHKKKKKHKSDREDRDDDERRDRDAGALKLMFAKDKSETNQPNQPSLKIKIPINPTEFRTNQQMQMQPAAPAPIKLKISVGGRDVVAAGESMSSSSSSHKKHKDKDKDRDRHSKKSKHNNNNSDGYHMPHQQPHYSIGKDVQQNFMMQQQMPTSYNFQQQLPPQQMVGPTPAELQHHQLLQQQQLQNQLMMQNYLYQNSSNG